jgi:hypothetical protein
MPGDTAGLDLTFEHDDLAGARLAQCGCRCESRRATSDDRHIGFP